MIQMIEWKDFRTYKPAYNTYMSWGFSFGLGLQLNVQRIGLLLMISIDGTILFFGFSWIVNIFYKRIEDKL